MRGKFFLPLLAVGLAACAVVPMATLPPAPSPTQAFTSIPTTAPTLTATPRPTPIPPALPAMASPRLAHIEFQDEFQGWGIAVNDNGHIVRTVDGGQAWLDATPADAGQIGFSTTLFVLDPDHVWVLMPGPDFYSASLYRTTDGGLTWASNPVPFGGADIQFLDPSIGRALADRGAGAGSNAVGLYQTSDGGVNWTSVFHNDPTEPGASDSLPLSGIKNGMKFQSADTGWVSGSVPVPGNIYLYTTHNGGGGWVQTSLPLPAGYENAMTMAHPPLFFGPDGLFPLTLYLPDSTGLLFYASQDGGGNWSAEGRTPVASGRYSFADASHGWVWDGAGPISMTSDGGRAWENISPSLSLSGVLNQIQFVLAGSNGYTGWALTGLDESNHSQLFKTTDNGATWMPLIP